MAKHKQSATVSSVETAANNMFSDTAVPHIERPLWKNIFWGLFALVALALLYLATQAGINADEDFQVKYSESIIDWYAGVPRDTSKMTAVEKQCDALNFTYRNSNMHYYGGFFEVIAGATNRMLGNKPDQLSYHTVRHVWVAIFGILALLFTALAVRAVANWKAALIALGLMALSPFFLGNALMNPKDIPFCAGFAMSLYYMIRFFQTISTQMQWKIVMGLVLGFTIALGTRAGGILLIAYFGLFSFIHIISTYGFANFFGNKTLYVSYIKYALIAVIGGYIGAVLFWPYALVSPLSHPFKALSEFDKFSIGIRVLFQGVNVMSDKAPWDYAPRSIYQTTPLIVIIGFILGLILSVKMARRFGFLPIFIAFFAAIFPVIYVIYKDSNMYNQWRHLLFVYPGIIMVASLAYYTLYDWLSPKNKIFGYAIVGILLLGSIMPLWHIVDNKALSFIYYNEATGGVKAQFGKNEMDYWGMSVKNGIDYLEQQGIISPTMDKQVTIISSMGYALQTYTKKYGDKVKWLYASYPNRYKYKWDYALYPSLYVNGDLLRTGNWPMKSATIHTIDVDKTPILAVMRQDTSQNVFKAQQLMKENKLQEAAVILKTEIAVHPDNEVAQNSLLEAYLNLGDFASAKSTADALLKLSPENTNAYYMKAVAQAQSGDMNGALNSLNICLKIAPDFAQARDLMMQIRNRK